MASDPLKKLLGLSDEPVDVNPDISLGVLANPHASQAPDLTGYFSQLETSRSPAHVVGIDARASDEEKRQQQETDASTELTDPSLSALHDREQREKLAVAGEPNRVAGASQLAVEKQKQDPLMKLLDGQAAGAAPSVGGFQMKPTISENGVTLSAETPPKPPKLSTNEQQVVDTAHAINDLGTPLLAKFAAKYPGIESDPTKYGSVLADILAPKIGKAAYMFGGMTDNDQLIQDTGAIQAWAVRAQSQGRITKPVMDMIMGHLPQPGYSAGANYDRLNRLIHEILPAQLQGISEGQGADALSLQQPQDPYSDPGWGSAGR